MPLKNMKNETLDAAMAAGSTATYTGAGMSGIGWFMSNEFFGLMGIAIGMAGLFVTWHYKRQAHKLRVREHELRSNLLKRGWHKTDTDFGGLEADE